MRISIRWTRVLLGAGLVVSMSGVAVGPVGAATLQVAAVDNAFEPRPITVAVGDTIVWTNSGQRPHTVTADNGSFDSATLTNGRTFSRSFSTPGTFAYYCSIHGGAGGQGMSGTITVAAAEVTPTTVATVATTTPPAASPTTVAPAASPTPTTRAVSPTTASTVQAAPAATPPTTAAAVPLARTGASSLAVALIGMGILLMGVACLMGTRPDPPVLNQR